MKASRNCDSNQTPGLPGFRVFGAGKVTGIGGFRGIFNALKIAPVGVGQEIFNALKIYNNAECMGMKQGRYCYAAT